MGGICCKPDLEWNPDGSQKPAQTGDQEKLDGPDLRKAAKDADVEMMHTLLRRMPKGQINSAASGKEVSVEELGNSAMHYCATNNHLRGAKKLMLYGHGLNTQNAEGKTPLHVCLEAGKRKVAHFLLSKGANINIKDAMGCSPLLAVILAGDKAMSDWLLNWRPEIDPPAKPVIKAAGHPGMEDEEEGLTLPAAPTGTTLKIDYDASDSTGCTLIIAAVRNGWFDTMKELVQRTPAQLADGTPGPLRAVLNTRSKEGETALGWVLKFAVSETLDGGEAEADALVSYLLAKGASPGVVCFTEGVPPLLLAAASGYASVFDAILQAVGEPALLTSKDLLGRTALHYAAAKGRTEIVTQLLAAGLSPVTPDSTKNTPLHLAAMRGHGEAAKELLAKAQSSGGDVTAVITPNSKGMAVLHLAFAGGVESEAQQAALNLVAAVHAKSPASLRLKVADGIKQDTPLLLAISGHQHAVVKVLIEHGADVNETNQLKQTPLDRCLASVTRETAALDAAIMKLLLAAGCNVAVGNPLLALCMSDCDDFAELALKELGPKCAGGAPDWTSTDGQGRSPLHLAALHNNGYICRLLAKQDKNALEVACPSGRTALAFAALSCSPNAMRVCLNNGSSINTTDCTGKSPMQLCLVLDKPESLVCAAMLLRAGAKPEDCVDLAGEGLMHRAVRYGAPDFIRLWHRFKGNLTLAATTSLTADTVPCTIEEWVTQNAAPSKDAGKKVAVAIEAVDLLDECETANNGPPPEEEDWEESDGEEEDCRIKKEARQAADGVAEGVEDEEEDVEWSEVSFCSPPSRVMRRNWLSQGAAWWDSWLDGVKARKEDGHDWDAMREQYPMTLDPTSEDTHMETKDGPIMFDDVLAEIHTQMAKERKRTKGPVSEALMDMVKNKVHPSDIMEGLIGTAVDEDEGQDTTTREFCYEKAKQHHERVYASNKIEQTDSFFIPGPTLYEGDPACMKVDTTPATEEELETLASSLYERIEAYDEVSQDVALQGGELRKRTAAWWIKSLSGEEFPMKVGAWQKMAKLTATAIREAQARKPLVPGSKPVFRKRTAWIGLPDLPSRPELEKTSPLIYAVRLARAPCVRALLDCTRKGLNDRDLFGHSAVDYAAHLACKDKRDKVMQFILDLLLSMRPTVGNPTFDTANSMHPLCLAVVAFDLPRIAYLVMKCGAKIDGSWMFAPDVPAYYQGKWAALIGDTESRMSPLHLAVLHKRMDAVKLLLDLGSKSNSHAWGYIGKAPYKLREKFLEDLQELRQKGQAIEPLLDARIAWMKEETANAKKHVKEKKANKKSKLMALAAKGKAFGHKAAAMAMGMATLIDNLKTVIQDVLGGPDPWVSPLHIACRFGLSDVVVLLLARGSALNGGQSAPLARCSPLEEALKYARKNFTYDNTAALRLNWESVRGPAFVMPGYSSDALAAKAKAGMMAMMDMSSMAFKMVIMAAKVVIDLILSSMKRPVAGYDSALQAAHVLIRNFAPIKPDESQSSAVIRDMQDNGTWWWVSKCFQEDDTIWLSQAQEDVETLKADNAMKYALLGVTKEYKEHDKIEKKFKAAVEKKYKTRGTKVFMEIYKEKSTEKSVVVKDALLSFATVSKSKFLEYSKAQMIGQLALTCQMDDRTTEINSEVAAARKAQPKVTFDEGELEEAVIAEYDMTDPQIFLGSSHKSFKSLATTSRTGTLNTAASAGGGVARSGPSMSRAKLITASRGASMTSSAGSMKRVAVVANSMVFTVPKTEEEARDALHALGNSDAGVFDAKRRDEDVNSLQLTSEKLKELINKAEKQEADAIASGEGKTGKNAEESQEAALKAAKALQADLEKMEKQIDDVDLEDIEANMADMLDDIDADIDGLLDQAEEFQEMIQNLVDMVDNL